NGVEVGRTTGEIYAKGTEVAKEDILPGDVLFFTYSDDGSATYCGIYVGDGVFIAANNEDSPVSQIDFTDNHYQQRFVGARRYV
ncbi:MAG: C40 family peptidase, partial [Oscillospiraceae bacterium]|nr:C40 family peptidase [Oscillospiraceae bacterium]